MEKHDEKYSVKSRFVRIAGQPILRRHDLMARRQFTLREDAEFTPR
jgi:hypothetical protein